MAEIAPKSLEATVTLKFFGPDHGVWPGTDPGNTPITIKCESFRFAGGEQLTDFSSGQDFTALHRLIKADPSVTIECNFVHPNLLLSNWQEDGPLVLVTLTAQNSTVTGSNDFVLTHKGIMALPDISPLDNPGKVSLEIKAYGQAATLTQLGT
jgi:hypothetical protein